MGREAVAGCWVAWETVAMSDQQATKVVSRSLDKKTWYKASRSYTAGEKETGFHNDFDFNFANET